MSTHTRKSKDPKQRSILDLFAQKPRTADTGSDPSKRKRLSSDDSLTGRSSTAVHVVQPSSSTSTLAGSRAAASRADSASISTCADIGQRSSCDDNLHTLSLAKTEAPPSLADIACPSFVVDTEVSWSRADIGVKVSCDADLSNSSSFQDNSECSFDPDIEDYSSHVGIFDNPRSGACFTDRSFLGDSTGSSWLCSDGSMQMPTTDLEQFIVSRLVRGPDQEAKENRQHVHQLLKVVCLLGSQGLAFRATDESEDSHNKGNFIEIFNRIYDNNEHLKVKMAGRYGQYTSPDYQNDMISVVADLVRENIARQVTKHFALLVDETNDISHKEQLSFVIRFVDVDGNIQEKAMGCYYMEKLDASSLAASIDDSIRKAGLDWKNCVAQCYDGASVMSGCFNGVQAKIKEIAPQAIYIHSHAHCLNLALVQTITNIQAVKDFFSSLQAVYVFLSQSSPRHELFAKAQKESGLQVYEFEILHGTRWFYWYSTVRKVLLRFETIVVVLDAIESQQCDKQSSSEARGLLQNIQSFEFLLTLLSMEVILRKINVLSEELQRKDLDLLNVCELSQVTRTELINLRQECYWMEIVNEATELAEKCGIETNEDRNPRPLPLRQHQLSNKLTEYYVSTTVGKRPSHYEHSEDRMPQTERLKKEVFFSTLDRFVSELDARFTDNMGLITAAGMFNPRAKNFLDLSSALVIADHYPGTRVNYANLTAELDTAMSFLSNKNTPGIHSVMHCLLYHPRGFSEVLNLLNLVLALPITTATNERFFSSLKRVKNFLQNRCGDERLSDLLIMACEPMEVQQIDLSEAIVRFADLRHRKYPQDEP
ncbi:zinc finger MYM-type protein 1-like [Ambystoma mexicanum]|uniref:zinc finger MYM-type protein 1-like n=1 Tax=Ambystoma mexicanum TaxID=8296 RepID=UPI0037E72E90